jgi:hypothetical protein
VISLIGDIATTFNTNPGVKEKATLPYVERSIVELQNQSEKEYKEQADYTLNAIKSMLQA